MRHQEQYPLRRVAFMFALDQLVVDLDERVADAVLGYAHEPTEQGHERQEQLDGQPAKPLREEHWTSQQDVQHQGGPGPHHQSADQQEYGPKRRRGRIMNVAQAKIRHEPQQQQHHDHQGDGGGDEPEKETFAGVGPGVFRPEIRNPQRVDERSRLVRFRVGHGVLARKRCLTPQGLFAVRQGIIGPGKAPPVSTRLACA